MKTELLNKKESKLKDLEKIQAYPYCQKKKKKKKGEREKLFGRAEEGCGVWPRSLLMRRLVQMGASDPISQLNRSRELCPAGKEGGTTGPSETGGRK